MNYIEEFQETNGLSPHTLATYTFFKAFKVNLGESKLCWNGFSATLTTEQLETCKSFLTYIKKEVKGGLKAGGCSRAMFFWFSKLQELYVFTPEIRTEIMQRMEICELICT